MSMRTFIGIKVIPEPELLQLYDELKDSLADDKINWVPKENMHITLHFLGEASETQLVEVKELIATELSSKPAFTLCIGGLSFFNKKSNPMALFFQIDYSDELLGLASWLKDGLQNMGFHTGTTFKPHVTVGRIKWLSDREHFYETMKVFKSGHLQTICVEEVILYKSILKPEGPVYEPLAVFPLTG